MGIGNIYYVDDHRHHHEMSVVESDLYRLKAESWLEEQSSPKLAYNALAGMKYGGDAKDE